MSVSINLYGFGSHFRQQANATDVDILIVHADATKQSCDFAVECKRLIEKLINFSDVTILSKKEEQEFSFIEKSAAIHLGTIYVESMEEYLSAIAADITSKR